MLLKELFQQPVSWTIVADYDDFVRAEFDISGVEYAMDVALSNDGEGVTGEVEFERLLSDDDARKIDRTKDGSLLQARYGLTGTGNAASVMSTIVDFLKQIVKKRNIATLHFSATEPSRQKLYWAMARRLAPNLGFKASNPEPGVFVLTK